MILTKLEDKKLIHPPRWLTSNTQYLTIMGSNAFGLSTDTSDIDLYGFCIPPREMVFTHLAGEIIGFGRQIKRFEQFQQHHIPHPDRKKDSTYDIQVFNIVKYFHLCMKSNPNMIDSIFTPRPCVVYSTQIGEHVRENRKLFLHKGAWYKFKGYAYSQMAKILNKVNSANPHRNESIVKYGYDIKFAYHAIRLLNQVEQILVEHDLDLEKNREQLKDIRRGEWTLEQVEDYFRTKESILEKAYIESTLRLTPDEEAIKKLLFECLEMRYGSIDAIRKESSSDSLLTDLRQLLNKYGG